MGLNTNFIRELDSKLLDSIRARYTNPKILGTKPHSIFTVLALILTKSMPVYFMSMHHQNVYFHNFALIFNGACTTGLIGLYIYAFYCWRVYLDLRNTHINTDKNMFFAESTGLYRKFLFYPALATEIILKFFPRPDFDQIRYQLRADFYHETWIIIFDSVAWSILIIELSRILFSNTFSWSDKKHYGVVIVTAAVMSGLQVAALNFASGHGII